MLGSDPFYFHFIYMCFIIKGASAPSFYLGTPMGGSQRDLPVYLSQSLFSLIFNTIKSAYAC